MADEKVYVTEEGLQKLKDELNNLKQVEREIIIDELREARAQGDLSENADYDAARERQSQNEARIKLLEAQIKNAVIIQDNADNRYVRVGSTVEIEELDTKMVNTYTIVGTIESDPLNGKLSNVTPLAEAILDQKVGSIVTVEVDAPYDVKILSVK